MNGKAVQALNPTFFLNHNLILNLNRCRKWIKIMITNRIKISYITIPPSTVKTCPVT
jgi:hypothetical protein